MVVELELKRKEFKFPISKPDYDCQSECSLLL